MHWREEEKLVQHHQLDSQEAEKLMHGRLDAADGGCGLAQDDHPEQRPYRPGAEDAAVLPVVDRAVQLGEASLSHHDLVTVLQNAADVHLNLWAGL